MGWRFILETLGAIKRRQKASRLMDKYAKNPLDLTGTSYEGISDPALLFIAQLYDSSKTSEYKDVVELGNSISIGCHG